MKKSRILFTAMAVALTLGTFQVEAKSAARERFDESLDRVKKCFKGKCTKMEALKAARDLGAAAIVVTATVYAGSKVTEAGLAQAGRGAKQRYGKGAASRNLGYASYQAGRPAAAMERGAAATGASVGRGIAATRTYVGQTRPGQWASQKAGDFRRARTQRRAEQTPLPDEDEDL